MRPIIALSMYRQVNHADARSTFLLFTPYIQAIEEAGGAAILLPLNTGDNLIDILFHVDGVVLTGGDDVDSTRYDQPPHEKAEPPDRLRDQSEIETVLYCMDRKKPLLAICRGLQILNVALSGTLIQDIPSLVPDAIQHSYDYDGDYRHAHLPRHEVRIESDSRIASIFGSQAQVNSFHHQAVDRVSDRLKVTATAPDGVIEAVEGRDAYHYLVGVQWHPEDMYRHDKRQAALFRSFIEATNDRD